MLRYLDHLKRLEEKSAPFPNFDMDDIILYGAGSLGELAVLTLTNMGIHPGIIVDKTKVGEVMGIPIRRIEEISKYDKKNKLFLVCISTLPFNEILSELKNAGVERVLHYYTYAYLRKPEVLSNGWLLEDDCFSITKADEICMLLSDDDKSLSHYLSFLYWKRFNTEIMINGNDVDSNKKYFKCDVIPKLHDREVFLDVGCYKGAIIEKFLQATKGLYKSITGVELVASFVDEARKNFKGYRDIAFYNCAISDYAGIGRANDQIGMACHLDAYGDTEVEVATIDSLGISPSIIKLHVEGDEYRCLCGGGKTIKESRPILFVMADHNSDGWYQIPKYVEQLDKYKLYFRIHDYCGNSAVWYFVPRERCRGCAQ